MIEYLNSILSEHLAHAISWTVIHSLWQASLIALIMSWFLNRYKHEDAIIRYRISYAALLFVFIGSISTFCFYYGFNFNVVDEVIQEDFAIALHGSHIDESSYMVSQISQFGFWLSHNVELLASMWVLGVLLFSIKLGGSFIFASHLKKQNTDFIPDNVYKGFIEIKNKLGIQQYVHFAESAKVNTPMLIGFLKPVILFPIGLINHLSIEETQAILAHELAHIKRNDFLHNLILSVVEMLFYYHPAVWWVSANVRMERENCCDDLAMKLIGDKKIYAKTLLKIEELKTTKIPSLAIPLSRNKNQLLHRISRIVNQPQTKSQIKERLIATCLLFTFFFGFGSTAMDHNTNSVREVADLDHKIVTQIVKDCDKEISAQLLKKKSEKGDCNCDTADKRFVNVSVSNITSADREITYIDTIPSSKKSKMTIINSGDDQEVVLKMKDGKIIELTVDGEEIEEEDYGDHLSKSEDVDEIEEEAQEYAKRFSEKLVEKEDEILNSYKHQFEIDDDDRIAKFHSEELGKELCEKLKLKSFELEGKEYEFEKLIEKFKSSDLPHFEFENGIGLNEIIHFQKLNIDSIFENLNEFGNGIVEFDSAMPKFYQLENDVPRWEGFGHVTPNPTDKFIHALSKDGIIDPDKKNTIELSGKYLKINGEKQTSNIFNKYKKLYENTFGHALSKNSKIKIEYDNDKIERAKFK